MPHPTSDGWLALTRDCVWFLLVRASRGRRRYKARRDLDCERLQAQVGAAAIALHEFEASVATREAATVEQLRRAEQKAREAQAARKDFEEREQRVVQEVESKLAAKFLQNTEVRAFQGVIEEIQ